jgi:hypothetical protein
MPFFDEHNLTSWSVTSALGQVCFLHIRVRAWTSILFVSRRIPVASALTIVVAGRSFVMHQGCDPPSDSPDSDSEGLPHELPSDLLKVSLECTIEMRVI